MIHPAQPTSRRLLLKQLAAAAACAALPGAAAAEFPAQALIDADPLRPRYHLMPTRGWMNDPCAPVFFRGRYHLFYQYNPGASVWGDMHWAHAVSRDLIHWQHRPIALAPTPGGPDSFGVFTGSMVFDGKTPTVLYTCVSPSSPAEATLWGSKPPEREAQCLATPEAPLARDPDAALDTWNKLTQPVVPASPPGMHVAGFRDPVPWRGENGSYYMLLASGEKNQGGNVLLYKSADLHAWTFQHVFAQGKPTGQNTDDTVDSGEMWECPDFFPLGDRHVLIHSTGTLTGRKTLWQSGRLDNATMQWTPEHEGILNHGPYYAPKTQRGAAGERILWGWIPESRPEADFAKAGWAGCMSLPRVLTLVDGQVRYAPAPQAITLRLLPLDPGSFPAQAELNFTISRARQPGPTSFTSPALSLDNSGADQVLWNGEPIAAASALPASFDIRCFVDHSVLELFLGDRLVLTHRLYTAQPSSLQLPANYTITPGRHYKLLSL